MLVEYVSLPSLYSLSLELSVVWLENVQEVERSLSPYLNSITISPGLINTIVDTRVSPDWIEAIIELDLKLGSIRGGVRVENRKNLDQTAENLRLAVRILSLLLQLPTSVTELRSKSCRPPRKSSLI